SARRGEPIRRRRAKGEVSENHDRRWLWVPAFGGTTTIHSADQNRGRQQFMQQIKIEPAPAYLMIVNSRLQRIDHGQFQICQAGLPSPIERKMICALPMMFSNGT